MVRRTKNEAEETRSRILDAAEEVFSERRSLIFKSLIVRRIYDRQNETLLYLAHSRQVQEGSAKMSLSSVPLRNQQATWTGGKPE